MSQQLSPLPLPAILKCGQCIQLREPAVGLRPLHELPKAALQQRILCSKHASSLGGNSSTADRKAASWRMTAEHLCRRGHAVQLQRGGCHLLLVLRQDEARDGINHIRSQHGRYAVPQREARRASTCSLWSQLTSFCTARRASTPVSESTKSASTFHAWRAGSAAAVISRL